MNPNIKEFLEHLQNLCSLHGMQINGCFSVATVDEETETDENVVRNIEHVSHEGVVRTKSRGNRP